MGEDPEVNFNLGYVDTSGTLLADATFFVPSDTDFTGWDSVALGFSYWDGMGFITLATGSIDVPESVPATSPLGQLVVVSLLIGATAHYFSRQRQSS
jgi:hypothetical protein